MRLRHAGSSASPLSAKCVKSRCMQGRHDLFLIGDQHPDQLNQGAKDVIGLVLRLVGLPFAAVPPVLSNHGPVHCEAWSRSNH